jgi:hypothetical protein
LGSLGGFDLDPFLLFTDGEKNPCIADTDPSAPSESLRITCRAVRGHMRAGKRLSNLDVVIPCEPAPDVIFTWLSECLIQDRVLRIFQEQGLTGFTTQPAKARLNTTGQSIEVSELLVTGWGGLAPEASGIREVARCPACGDLHYSEIEEPRELVDVNNWDGSDFFMIWPLPRFRFVTAKVAEVCRKFRLTGVLLERNLPTDQTSSGYSPGRLSYYMPPERAHALGDALQIF